MTGGYFFVVVDGKRVAHGSAETCAGKAAKLGGTVEERSCPLFVCPGTADAKYPCTVCSLETEDSHATALDI